MVAAAAHDYRHLGVTNAFLINAEHPVALLHSDDSVLERHHLASFFHLLHTPAFNIFCNFTNAAWREARASIIALVLATDLAHSFRVQNEIDDAVHLLENKPLTCGSDADQSIASTRLTLMKMVLKCADISHPAKSLTTHFDWSQRISAEFFHQGALEREAGGPVSGLCDQDAVDVPNAQMSFIQFVVRKPFDAMLRFTGATPLSR